MTTLMTTPKTGYPALDDAQLAQHARTDPQAFAELYRRHVRSIYRYHMAHTGNVKDAEDLTSQTFMAALEGIRSFRGTAPYISWLIGIASKKRALFSDGNNLRSRWTRRSTSQRRACPPIKPLRGACKWISSLRRSGPSARTAPKRSSCVFSVGSAPQKLRSCSAKAKPL